MTDILHADHERSAETALEVSLPSATSTVTVRLSIIIPVLNEARCIEATLRQARQPGVHEIIVVDAGSSDATLALAQPLAHQILPARPGRAAQMNAGAAAATGDILLFLHADTLLPDGFASAVDRALADPRVCSGRFDVRLEPTSPLLWLTGALMNLRSRWSRIATGDQAIFVRRETFERLGGLPDLPLMEDIEFSRRLKRAGVVACLRQQVVTSSRRWRNDGVVRTILLMWTLRLLFFLGVPAATLKRVYADRR